MKISVIGAAGTLGSCAAFNIITHRMASELVLIDPWKDGLKAQWMDLRTAITWQNVAVRMGEYEDMADSDIVLITAGAPSGIISSRKELLPANLPIIKQNAEMVNRYCPDAIVITATNPVDPLNYAIYLLSENRDRRRFIGYSLNDTFRFRMLAANALGVRPIRVQGTVIGEHDESQVMLFSTLRLDGMPVNVSEEFKRRIRDQASKTLQELESLKPKRATGWTSAVGIEAIIRAIQEDNREIIPSNAVLNGEYGYRDLSTTVPLILGKGGIQGIQTLELTPEEKEGLEHSVDILRPYMSTVEEFVGLSSTV